jgi:hypothetical protein
MRIAMSQKQSDDALGILLSVVTLGFVLYCGWVVFDYILNPTPEVLLGENIMEDVWRFESSPSDRRAILEGLSAMECIDAGICQLVIKLPVAEW